MIVVDASAVVAALLVAGPAGDVARDALRSQEAHAPHLLDVEANAWAPGQRPEDVCDALAALRTGRDLPQ